MSARTRRNLLLAAGAVFVWYVVILFVWALKPLEDSVPVGANAKGEPVSVTVQCNTLFASSAFDGTLPVLTSLDYDYSREPCELVQSDARKVFVLDTLVAIVLVGGLTVIALRPARRESPELSIA